MKKHSKQFNNLKNIYYFNNKKTSVPFSFILAYRTRKLQFDHRRKCNKKKTNKKYF